MDAVKDQFIKECCRQVQVIETTILTEDERVAIVQFLNGNAGSFTKSEGEINWSVPHAKLVAIKLAIQDRERGLYAVPQFVDTRLREAYLELWWHPIPEDDQ